MADTQQDRDEAQRLVVEALAQHASYLHRASTATYNRIKAIIDESGKALASELLDRMDNLSPGELAALQRYRPGTRMDRLPTRVQGVVKFIDAWSEAMDQRIRETFSEDGQALAGQEVRYTEGLMGKVLAEASAVSITAQQAYARAMEEPLLGQFVEDMLADVSNDTRSRVYARIREGVSSGQTNAEIVRALRGTQALNWRDGMLQITRTAAERVVRTGRNHISSVTYEDTYKALGVEFVVWTSTLDGRTSKVCASRDGERYEVSSNHPRPPAHPNCRSQLAPSFDGDLMGKRPYVRAFKPVGKIPEAQRTDDMIGQVSAKTTYADWFGRQPASFQREWLGPQRYKLYRDGGYKIDRFVDPRGKEYSLDELAARDRETFQQLFGEA